MGNFNPHSSYEEWHISGGIDVGYIPISIHILRTKSDHGKWFLRSRCAISIHILRTKSDEQHQNKHFSHTISIHILRTKSDRWQDRYRDQSIISIHILRTKSDQRQKDGFNRFNDFNPHSSYEEWPVSLTAGSGQTYFNPHSSYEEWLLPYQQLWLQCHFNPHSSYEEWRGATVWPRKKPLFQSTFFVRRVTFISSGISSLTNISIHILRTKSDAFHVLFSVGASYFNPHSSYEEWRHKIRLSVRTRHFNPHSSYEEWPIAACNCSAFRYFNPHSSYEEWLPCFSNIPHIFHFNPHSSYEEWPFSDILAISVRSISIHILRTKSDFIAAFVLGFFYDFNPHSSYEEWPLFHVSLRVGQGFQSTFFVRRVTHILKPLRTE